MVEPAVGPGAGRGRSREAALANVACLRGRQVEVAELPGGLTNVNLRVTAVDAGPAVDVVVRIAQPGTELLAIDRYAEASNSRAAAAAGVGAPVVEHVAGAGLLVVGFLEGRTFTERDLHDPATLLRVATACRRLHSGPRFVSSFDMFQVQRHYLGIVTDRGFRVPNGYTDNMASLARIERAFSLRPVPTVPCHNDLLAGNFIDDGDHLWLIDYEYSGNNDPYFELGNLASEAHLSPQQLELLVAAYDGAAPGQADRSNVARARLWGLMANYGWTLWASIQDAVSSIDYDFWGWGTEKYDRAVAGFASVDFERLLEEVAAGG